MLLHHKGSFPMLTLQLSLKGCTPLTLQHLNDLPKKVHGNKQLDYHLVNHVSAFKTKPMFCQRRSGSGNCIHFHTSHAVKAAKHRVSTIDTLGYFGFGSSDPFLRLSLSRLWAKRTTDAAIALLSQLIPCAIFFELPNVPTNMLARTRVLSFRLTYVAGKRDL